MKLRRSFPLLLLLAAAPVRGDELEDALAARQSALDAWESGYDELDARLPRDGNLRAALDRAGAERSTMRSLLGEARSDAGEFSSAKFKAEFLQREWESARKEAERISAAKDARYAELMNGARSTRDSKTVDLRARDVALEEWRGRVQAQGAQYTAFANQIAPLMRTYTLPDEQAAYDHAKALQAQRDGMYSALQAEEARFNAAVNAWNADRQGIEDEWTRRLAEIEAFMKEDGRRTLEATQLASKKEREFREAEGKFSALLDKEQALLADYDRRFAAAAAALHAVGEVEAIRAAASGRATPGSAPQPYAARASAQGAQAVAPPPAPAASSRSVRAHVFVLPPVGTAAEPDEAEAEVRRESAALAADALAAQFRPAEVSPVSPADVPPAPARPAPGGASAPAVFLGPAPVGGSGPDDDGSAVVVLDDDALTRAFHPGIFISDAEYRRACETCERTGALIPKLQAQLDRLRGQREGLAGDAQEFDAMRREITVGAAREVVGLYATRLDLLLKNGKFAAALSAAQKARLETAKRAFDTLKLGLVLPHADAAAKPVDAENLQREAWEEGAAALAELAGSQVGGAWASKFLEQGGNVLKAGGKLSRHLHDPDRVGRSQLEQAGQDLKTSIEMVGTWCPPIALGIGIEAVGERGLQWAITQDAVDSLSAGVRSTDEAIVYLADRLQRTQAMHDEAVRIVANHEAVPAWRRRGFKGGS